MKYFTFLLALFTFLAADTAFAFPGFNGSLGNAAAATDIIRFNCGAPYPGVTINQARARIRDKSPVAQPAVNVQIAVYSGGVCGAYTVAKRDEAGQPPSVPQAYGVNGPDNNLIFSDWTYIAMPAVGGQYCVKIFKTADNQNTGAGGTAIGAENYELDSDCKQASNPNVNPPTGATYLQNQ